jgi:septum formation inhibitor MinC
LREQASVSVEYLIHLQYKEFAHKMAEETNNENETMERKGDGIIATTTAISSNNNNDNNEEKNEDQKSSHKPPSATRSDKNTNKKKRRRTSSTAPPLDRKSRENAWKQERYDKLLYETRKALTKQIKQTKTFVCQRLIRKLKQQEKDEQPQQQSNKKQEPQDNTTFTAAKKNKSNPATKEDQLQAYKAIDIDSLVQEALRRLGITSLNPSWQVLLEASTSTSKPSEPSVKEVNEEEAPPPTATTTKTTDTATTIVTTTTTTNNNAAIVQIILQHQKMEACLESLNDKVTEYRRWCLHRDELASGAELTTAANSKNNNNKKQKKTLTNAKVRHDASLLTNSSVFCHLGGGNDDDDDADDNTNDENGAGDDSDNDEYHQSPYGPGGDLDGDLVKKRNRKGQRARRAKAQALQAKKNGRRYESSNWRQSQQQQQEQQPPSETTANHYSRQSSSQERPVRSKPSFSTSSQKVYPAVDSHPKHSAYPSFANNKRQHQQPAAPRQQETKDAAQHHPSWAAKQAQSTGIVVFQGTKITFD